MSVTCFWSIQEFLSFIAQDSNYFRHYSLTTKWDHASCTRTCKHTGDRLLDTTLTVCMYFFNMKGAVFQPRVLQLNLDTINQLPNSRYHNRKNPGMHQCGTQMAHLKKIYSVSLCIEQSIPSVFTCFCTGCMVPFPSLIVLI